MYKICVFGGTTEGRELVEFLNTQPCEVTACVATEYGQSLLPESERLTVSAKRLPVAEIEVLLQHGHFDLVIDATHPYAASITESIARACRATRTETWRLLRGASAVPNSAVFVENTEQAVEFLTNTEGNILLTTGSKELGAYAALPNFAARCWVRVLPVPASLEACRAAGLEPAHILAMQGPFSAELNTAMLHAIDATWLVTKDGGTAGGFAEKAEAAEQTGTRLLVIGRPPQHEGLSLGETITALCKRFSFRRTPEVAVVGIGPGSEAVQTAEVRTAIDTADCLIGAPRMLESAVHGALRISAIAPADIAAAIAAHPECSKFTVIMSGDTGFFSGTKRLLPLMSECHVRVLPGVSSMVYLCARLGVSYEDVLPVSLHGREHDLVPDVRAHERLFVLVGGEGGMAKLCSHLTEHGLGRVRVSVGERLSYPDEAITCGTAAELSARTFDPLSVALLENPAPDAVVTHGLPDDSFLRNQEPGHVVPMTKSEVRSVCLSKLALTERAICWDIGAGTGSVSIEMALQAKHGTVYAVERKDDALALLKRNQAAFSVENMRIVSGIAPEACEPLPAPTHVFLGGTAGNLREILETALRKNPNARIVATAVSLESVAALCVRMADFETAECVSLQVAKSSAAGGHNLMRAQNPIFIFTFQTRKPDRE